MEERLKNRIVLILAVFCLLFFVFAVSSCNGASRQKLARDKEMAARLDLEEKMSKIAQEKIVLDEKIKAGEKELSEEQASLDSSKKSLQQEEMVNISLKDELAKVTKVKDDLEEEFKNIQGKNKKIIK